MARRGAVFLAKHTQHYRADDMTGQGAGATGGRWNAKGTPVVYASASIALAALETLVQRGTSIAIRNSFLVRLDIPPAVWRLRERIKATQLDPTWLAQPAGSTTVDLGTRWLGSGHSPLLLVPSVIVPEEYNLLVNPAQRAAAAIVARVVRQFTFDPRLASRR